MQRSERTQMYLDLAKLSSELEANQHSATELMDAMSKNPLSPYYDSAVIYFNKLKLVREQLYKKERECIMYLSGFNAIPIGTLEVLPNGKVVAVE